jgi:hypothetical protein
VSSISMLGVAVATLAMAMSPLGAVPAAAETSVSVPAGTHVGLTFLSAVDARTAKAGEKVHLKVVADVIVDRHVVIKSGTPLTATITGVKKPGGVQNEAHVILGFMAVDGVDGRPVELNDLLIRPSGAIFGGNLTIAVGDLYTASTKNAVTIKVT